jgi:hypothetical protein
LIFIGLRYNTGYDYTNYIRYFENTEFSKDMFKVYLVNSGHAEPGYILLNALVKLFTNNYYVLQFSVTLFVCMVVYRYVIKYSEYPIVSFSLFIIFNFSSILMGQIRQSIAMAILLISIKYIFEKKLFRFILIIIAASMFHISAIIFLPIYFFNCKYNRTLSVTALLFSPLLYYAGDIVNNFILSQAQNMPNRLFFLTTRYLSDSIYIGSSKFNTGLYYLSKIIVSTFLLATISTKNKQTHFFLNALVFSIIVQGIAKGFFIINRFTSYFTLFDIIAYTYLFKLVNFRKYRDFVFLYCFCILLFFIFPPVRSFTVDKDKIGPEGPGFLGTFIPYYNVLYHPPAADLRN